MTSGSNKWRQQSAQDDFEWQRRGLDAAWLSLSLGLDSGALDCAAIDKQDFIR